MLRDLYEFFHAFVDTKDSQDLQCYERPFESKWYRAGSKYSKNNIRESKSLCKVITCSQMHVNFARGILRLLDIFCNIFSPLLECQWQ